MSRRVVPPDAAGLRRAVALLRHDSVVAFPTETVYGLGAHAFSPAAVAEVYRLKNRPSWNPLIVHVPTVAAARSLAADWPSVADELAARFWPGPLTLVVRQQPSLQWDLGETRGTVAVRMPDHDVAIELLSRTGPMAVSSANRTGLPPAQDADNAEKMLGEHVRVILDAGPTPGAVPSTIVDCTTDEGRVLRQGVITLDQLNEVAAAYDALIRDES